MQKYNYNQNNKISFKLSVTPIEQIIFAADIQEKQMTKQGTILVVDDNRDPYRSTDAVRHLLREGNNHLYSQ